VLSSHCRGGYTVCAMAGSIFWYDLETFGIDRRIDRIAQFAGLRTNERFEPIEEPLVRYCSITPDYVPDPLACLLTGITPQTTWELGRRECDFAAEIRQALMVPGTCVSGYNNIRFDDEFIRSLFYRNFFDPYEREYAAGNSRWDLIDAMRVAHDLRPEGINWPQGDEGKPSFRLEELAAANAIEQERAHDAMSDVHATIGLARMLHDRKPRLFSYLFSLRKREQVRKLVDLQRKDIVLYTAPLFTRPGGCTTAVVPIGVNPRNDREVIVFDLRFDPRPILERDSDGLSEHIFSPGQPSGVTTLATNRCPAVSPVGTMTDEAAKRLGLDLELCTEHARLIREDATLTNRIARAYAAPPGPAAAGRDRDPELQIYSGGFFSDDDRAEFTRVRNAQPEELPRLSLNVEDPRIPELLWRYIGRNYPEQFDTKQRERWRSFCAGRILMPPSEKASSFAFFERKIAEHLADKDLAPSKKRILQALGEYRDYLAETVLSDGA